jgi:MFS family permease
VHVSEMFDEPDCSTHPADPKVAILGFLADKGSSRRLPFVFGLLTIAAATIMFWLARSLAILIIARILTGLSASAVWVVGIALIVDAMGSDQAGVAFGYVSMALTIGTVAGPSLGGIM